MHKINSLPHDRNDKVTEPLREVTSIEHLADPGEQLTAVYSPSPYDPHYERIRALRTELLLRRNSIDSAYMIALISPCPGEGRSRLAAELAIAFAQMNRPTLLVDADLRNPQQHILFDTDNQHGLAEAIESGTTPKLHSVRRLPRMSVLTAGDIPPNPPELLSSNRFALMIEEWRNKFEFVVIDTSPVMFFSDGIAVANLVGSVLTLSRAQRTSYKHMHSMLRQLTPTHAQVLGGVINHF